MSMPGFGSDWAGDRIARLIEDGRSGPTFRNRARRPFGGLRRLIGRLRTTDASPLRVRGEVRHDGRSGSRPVSEERVVRRTDASAF